MRLWHKDLILVLPKNQLLGQWRECCLIAKNIAEKGTPNHILVNKIMYYPLEHFNYYCTLVYSEMRKRNYSVDWIRFQHYSKCSIFETSFVSSYFTEQLFKDWHNDRYLKQCYYNLQEKFDCDGVSEEDWLRIKNKFEEKLNK